ncbi:MAG: DUF1028 domain-containing protein [candidate division Zixibacteria bacterium]|nr:DUF1028 domain-containing protein [candidate division Zixibacteria bacterium]
MCKWILTGLVMVTAICIAADVAHADWAPVATYSIVARDSATGQLGVAVQSHWFSVGPIVPWAQAGVGAIATQSFVKIDYGPDGLDRLAHCIAYAGHVTGPGFSAQANLMADSTVPTTMAKAYRAGSQLPFAERLLVALQAAQGAKGDIRGRQSAALLVVDGKRYDKPWQGRLIELRIEDHPDPVGELARLLRLQNAYDWMNRGDLFAEKKDWDSAAVAYGTAEGLAPEIVELPFWHAVTLAMAGKMDDALPIFRRVFAAEARWIDLVPRLVPAGLLPNDSTVVKRILAEAPRK